MKIIFNRQEAIKACAPLMCAVSTKGPIPETEGILIEANSPTGCTLTTFDTEKGIRINFEANVVEEGSYVINAQKFNQTIKVMDSEEIILSVDSKGIATFESGRSTHKTGSLSASNFPEIPYLTTEKGFKIKQATLRKMLLKVSYAMGVNDPRPVLNGCYVRTVGDELSLVACDTFKLAVCSCKTEFEKLDNASSTDFSFIIPVKSVNELVKLLSDDEDDVATVYMSYKNIVIHMGGIIFFSRLINGDYLDYDRVIIKNHKIFVTLEKDQLLSALERASLITEEKISGNMRPNVKLEICDDVLKVSAVSTAGSIYDEVPVEHDGEDISISFKNRFLSDSVRACTADRVKIALSSKLMSINIKPADEDENIKELFMLLPVRTKD